MPPNWRLKMSCIVSASLRCEAISLPGARALQSGRAHPTRRHGLRSTAVRHHGTTSACICA
eukprot:4098431-Prymnesium_polylepis.1